MTELKIDAEAIQALKARVEARGPMDPDQIVIDTMRTGGKWADGQTIMISPGFMCVYSVEFAAGRIYDHLTISTHVPNLPVTPEIVDRIGAAFGLGERKTWAMQFELMGGHQIIRIRTPGI